MNEKSAPVHYTYEDYLEWPDDGKRHEIVNGAHFVTPSPNAVHQWISDNLQTALRRFVTQKRLGVVLRAPIDVVLADDCVVQPDLLFVLKERISIVGEKAVLGPPDLVIEILSPSTANTDRGAKLALYGRFSVQEYWIVDPRTHAVHIYARHGRVFFSKRLLSRAKYTHEWFFKVSRYRSVRSSRILEMRFDDGTFASISQIFTSRLRRLNGVGG